MPAVATTATAAAKPAAATNIWRAILNDKLWQPALLL